jgi:hypothetical protein
MPIELGSRTNKNVRTQMCPKPGFIMVYIDLLEGTAHCSICFAERTAVRRAVSTRTPAQHKADAEPPAAPEEWDSPRDVHGEGNVSQAVSLFQHWFRSCHIYIADSREL